MKKFLPILFICSACQKEIKLLPQIDKGQHDELITSSQSPNFILFIADDLGYYAPEFTGGKSYSTPNLNFMASNGMQFTQCHTHPDGYPSRLALMTGEYNFRNYTVWGTFPDSEYSIANMLKDNGYKNCFVGKWQFNGGDTKIKRMGFDNYRVFNPFASDDQRDFRYKNPEIYENAAYLPDSLTRGRYSEDMFYDYGAEFITANKTSPFFLTYSFNLCAQPYVPAPNHPDYANWNSANDRTDQDTSYFRSMVEYMDFTIGRIIKKVEDDNLSQKTLILFLADNSTQELIFTRWRNQYIEGTKTQTNIAGTLTPLVALWPGRVQAGTTSRTLSDYTDFFKTFAELAGISDITKYGEKDGVSLADDLLKKNGRDRDFVYCWWQNNPTKPLQEFIYTDEYKLYGGRSADANFFNIHRDIWETNPIPESEMSPRQSVIKAALAEKLDSLQQLQ
jgi:arylsulfatase A